MYANRNLTEFDLGVNITDATLTFVPDGSKVTVVLLFLNVLLFFYIFKFEAQWRAERTFHPTLSRNDAAARMAAWEHAVRQTVAA